MAPFLQKKGVFVETKTQENRRSSTRPSRCANRTGVRAEADESSLIHCHDHLPPPPPTATATPAADQVSAAAPRSGFHCRRAPTPGELARRPSSLSKKEGRKWPCASFFTAISLGRSRSQRPRRRRRDSGGGARFRCSLRKFLFVARPCRRLTVESDILCSLHSNLHINGLRGAENDLFKIFKKLGSDSL